MSPHPLCEVNMQCHLCPRSVDNAIIFAAHPRGFHRPAQKSEENFLIFIMKGEVLINSVEYAGTTLHTGEFILQAVGSKFEMLAMTDVEYVCYSFGKPELFCEGLFNYIMSDISPPLIYSPLKIIPELRVFLEATKAYLQGEKICRDLLSLKRKELGYILSNFYTNYELSTLVHPLAQYINSFQYFVHQNHSKVKTVEEFAQLGGYTATTFRRIFNSVFHQPVYEWMQERRKEGIVYELKNTKATISEICFMYGFESLPHFSNYCKKNFGASPRTLRAQKP